MSFNNPENERQDAATCHPRPSVANWLAEQTEQELRSALRYTPPIATAGRSLRDLDLLINELGSCPKTTHKRGVHHSQAESTYIALELIRRNLPTAARLLEKAEGYYEQRLFSIKAPDSDAEPEASD